MAVPFDILTYPNDALTVRSKHVTQFDGDLLEFAANLKELADLSGLAGLAAPQVGVNKRIIVVGKDYNPKTGFDISFVAVNPRIVDASSETLFEREGCASFPGMFAPVHRKKWVEVIYQRVSDGGVVRTRAEGMEARVWQHEIEHLDGILMIDRLTSFRRKEFLTKFKKRNKR